MLLDYVDVESLVQMVADKAFENCVNLKVAVTSDCVIIEAEPMNPDDEVDPESEDLDDYDLDDFEFDDEGEDGPPADEPKVETKDIE